MGCALAVAPNVSVVVCPIWCIFMIPAQPLAIAVTPAARSAPVVTSLWHLAYDGSCFQVTLSESGLVGSGGSPALSILACWAAADSGVLAEGVSPPPPAAPGAQEGGTTGGGAERGGAAP